MSAATHSEVAPEHQHETSEVDLKAGRRRVARTRGVLSGILLALLGAWAALAPFIGPYFNFGIEPRSGDAFHWTSGRGLYEVLPGGVTFLAGIVLLLSASRVLTVLMAWLAALAGVWLVIATTVATRLTVGLGSPPANASADKLVALPLLYFFATGAAIAVIAGIAIGRLSVHSVRDVRAAERLAEAEAAAEAQRQDAERVELERRQSERLEHERRRDDHRDTDAQQGGLAPDHHTAVLPVAGSTDRDAPTAAHPTVDDRYAAPSAGPYEPVGNRDTAGSSSYAGHRSGERGNAGEPAAVPAAQVRGTEPARPGAHAVDPAPAGAASAEPTPLEPSPGTPPAPGGMDQYRYGTHDTPAPPAERDR